MEKELVEKIFKIKNLKELTQQERNFIADKSAELRDFLDIYKITRQLILKETFGKESNGWSDSEDFKSGFLQGFYFGRHTEISQSTTNDWLCGYSEEDKK